MPVVLVASLLWSPVSWPQDESAPSPGSDDVSEEESRRALERILVREGGLVLQPGAFDIEPSITYQYRSANELSIVDQGAGPQVANLDVSRDTFLPTLAVRAGLPFASQAEIRLPYVNDRRVAVIGGADEQTNEASGLGDVEVVLTKQILSGRGGTTGLLGAMTWKTATGEHDPSAFLSPGSGYESIQTALIGVKRQDPLVFYGNLYHAVNLSEDDLDPGDTTGLRLGLLLAANPDTSLRSSVEFSRTARLEQAGRTLPGSDITYIVLEIGIATTLTARTLLDLRVGAGLTSDSPDFTVGVALPIRFQ